MAKFDKVTRGQASTFAEDASFGGATGKDNRMRSTGFGDFGTDAVNKNVFKRSLGNFGEHMYGNRSRAYYENLVQSLGNVSRRQLLQDEGVQPTTRLLIGGMYMFIYEPQGKRTLPYYDKFPLVIYMKKKGPNFMGLNIHYLDYRSRYKLLNNLMDLYEGLEDDLTGRNIRNKKRRTIDDWYQLDQASFMQERIRNLSYDRLKGKERYELHAPCIKLYRRKNIKSKIVRIDMSDWPLAAHLPVEHFTGAPRQKIFHDSKITAQYGYKKGIRNTRKR